VPLEQRLIEAISCCFGPVRPSPSCLAFRSKPGCGAGSIFISRSAHRQYGKVWISDAGCPKRGYGLRAAASENPHKRGHCRNSNPRSLAVRVRPKRSPARCPRWGSLSHVRESPVWRSSLGLDYRNDIDPTITQLSLRRAIAATRGLLRAADSAPKNRCHHCS
jgi:hypothetical protein